MRHFRLTLQILAFAAFTIALSSLAQAQATRTWVSGVGDDVNPCSRTAPCKTFAGAISKTANGGEINALDPGGYGTISVINKSITIDGGGTFASILSAGATAGVTVNDSTDVSPGTHVTILRNLSINGAGTGLNGIRFLNGKTLVVQNVNMQGFTTHGIEVSTTMTANLKVDDVRIENCGGDGIRMTTTAGQVIAMINDAVIQNCASDGIEAVSNVVAGIRDSVITHNSTTGIQASGSNSILNIDDVFVSFSTTGLKSALSSALNVSDSIIAQNGTGLNANGGTLASFQGNSLINNPTPGAFTGTTAKQ